MANDHRQGRTFGLRQRDNRDGLVMVLPVIVIVVATIVIPIAWNVILAFQDKTFTSLRKNGLFGPLSFTNFVSALGDERFLASLGTTIVFSLGATIGSIIAGLIVALAFRRPFRGRGPLRALLLLPYVAPVVAVAYTWSIMLHPQYGILNHLGTTLLGWEHPVDFLGTPGWAMVTVIAFEIWRYFPFAVIFLSAALLGLPKDVDEAALIDGATPWQSFRHVLLPQLMPVIALLSVLRLIVTFNKFDDIFLLTGGAAGTEVAAIRIYNLLVGRFDISGAAANALVLCVVMAVALVAYLALTRREERAG
ncbi:MAG: sugar ABC transporter permease [Protaetiibacter sp.]